MTFSNKEFIGSFILVQFCIDMCNNDETANAYKMSYTLQPFIKGLFTRQFDCAFGSALQLRKNKLLKSNALA